MSRLISTRGTPVNLTILVSASVRIFIPFGVLRLSRIDVLKSH